MVAAEGCLAGFIIKIGIVVEGNVTNVAARAVIVQQAAIIKPEFVSQRSVKLGVGLIADGTEGIDHGVVGGEDFLVGTIGLYNVGNQFQGFTDDGRVKFVAGVVLGQERHVPVGFGVQFFRTLLGKRGFKFVKGGEAPAKIKLEVDAVVETVGEQTVIGAIDEEVVEILPFHQVDELSFQRLVRRRCTIDRRPGRRNPSKQDGGPTQGGLTTLIGRAVPESAGAGGAVVGVGTHQQGQVISEGQIIAAAFGQDRTATVAQITHDLAQQPVRAHAIGGNEGFHRVMVGVGVIGEQDPGALLVRGQALLMADHTPVLHHRLHIADIKIPGRGAALVIARPRAGIIHRLQQPGKSAVGVCCRHPAREQQAQRCHERDGRATRGNLVTGGPGHA